MRDMQPFKELKNSFNEIVLAFIILFASIQIPSPFGSISLGLILGLLIYGTNSKSWQFGKKYLICCILFFLFNSILILVNLNTFSEGIIRSFISSILFFLLIQVLITASTFKVSPISLSKIVIILVAISLIIDFFVSENERISGFFFAEPSHLAMAMAPFISFTLFNMQKQNLFLLFCSLIIILLSFSLTLFLMTFITLIALAFTRSVLSFRNILKFTLLIIGPFTVTILINIDYISARAFGLLPDSESNLSSLVYLNGWLLLLEYLDLSNYLGIGFNRMGEAGLIIETHISEIISQLTITGIVLNHNDGSFLISKLGSEFGIFGIFIIVIFEIYILLKLFKRLREVKGPNEIFLNLSFAFVLVFATFISFFIRSAGYFSTNVIINIFGILIAQKLSRHYKKLRL